MTKRIYIRDVVSAELCVAGFKEWSTSNGFDWRDLIRNGMAIEDVEKIDCEMARRVLAHVREKQGVAE